MSGGTNHVGSALQSRRLPVESVGAVIREPTAVALPAVTGDSVPVHVVKPPRALTDVYK